MTVHISGQGLTDPVVLKIAQTLCFASRIHQEMPFCPMCEGGVCQKVMWETFIPEARAVWQMLLKTDRVKAPQSKNLLPGLGG